MAQPLFDPEVSGPRIGVWKVLLSTQALRDARNLSRSGQFNLLETNFRELASGLWRRRNMSKPIGSDSQKSHMKVPVLRMKCSETTWILWQIDVGTYHHLDSVGQLVKVWRIIHPDECEDVVDAIISLQDFYGPDLCRQCIKRPLTDASHPSGAFVPAQFSRAGDHILPVPSKGVRYVKQLDKGRLEISNKFYSLTERLLRSLPSDDRLFEFPCELSHEELRIVSHSSTPCLILGRSGTGKTTCLIYKILTEFRARQLLPGENAIRQLLLTQSPYLSRKLRNYTQSLLASQMSVQMLPDLSFDENMLPDAGNDTQETETIFTESSKEAPFPLVTTFGQFLGLLENEIKLENRGHVFEPMEAAHHSRFHRKPRVIDFSVFKTEYWTRLPQKLTRSISVELVFAEIMGVIKGSVLSADTLAALSCDEYLRTSCRLAPAFATDREREKVYEIYQHYEKRKRDRKDIDPIDRVIALLEEINRLPALRNRFANAFEHIYIDEVQDLRCLDIALILKFIGDARGVHLAGDTAQCISKDSTFRFTEIKDLFYCRYAASQTPNQQNLAKPTLFALAKNYRSHQGILNLASMVMKLLWTGFPDTVDKLDPEFGLLDGPKPWVFVGSNADILSRSMIGEVNLTHEFSDFGAEQVVLVRDSEAKADLRSRIGDVALILTILESKGMEFDDVLIYNFFSDSLYASSYRCLHLLLDQDAQFFDRMEHAALCSELKHLYVAVTRARKRLWLLESSKDLMIPILRVFENGVEDPLVEIVRPTDEDFVTKVQILRAGGAVDPERWAERGRQFLQEKNFADAHFCFKKAGDDRGMTIASAFLTEQNARSCEAREDHDGFVKGFEAAIELFLQVELIHNGSKCMEYLGEYERAATLWYDQNNYVRAAELFQDAKSFEKASKCYHLSDSYDKAAEMLRLGNLHDQLIRYLSENHDSLEQESCRRYSRLCNLWLKQGRVSPNLRALTIGLLGTNEEKEQFFKEFEMTSQLAELYRTQGKSIELYRLLMEDGQLRSALEVVASSNLYYSIQQTEIETAFNLLSLENLLCAEGNNSSSSFSASHWKGKPPYLLSASTEWDVAARILSSFKKGMNETLANLQDQTLKECLCLSITALLPEFIGEAKSISHLPTEVLREMASLVPRLLSEQPGSYSKSLLLVCGVFTTPSQKEIYLPWSPLHQLLANESDSNISEQVHEPTKKWILSKLSAAVAAFHDASRNLWASEWPETCRSFLAQRTCSKARSNECRYSHRITTEECSSMITGLLRVASVFSGMSRIYLTRVMDEQFQEKFCPRRRHWLEKLIQRLDYVSSFDQASSAVTAAVSVLHSDQAYSVVAIFLEDLLFHRISIEWQKRNSLASLVAQCQLSSNLGHEVNSRFLREITRRFRNPRVSASYIGNTNVTLDVVHSFHRIQAAIFESNENFLLENIQLLLRSFNAATIHAFSNFDAFSNINAITDFHAIVSVYEFVATFLLCTRFPGQSIVIPWSWAILHLAPIMRCPSALAVDAKKERPNYTHVIQDLVFSFCSLLERLDQVPDRIPFTAGSRFLPSSVVQRRNMELLAVIVLNMGSENIPIWNRTQKIFSLPTSPLRFLQSRNFQEFVWTFVPSYKVYDGKDWLTIVDFDEQNNLPPSMRRMIERGASRSSLSKILSASASYKVWKNSATNHALASSDFSEHETQAVLKIQSFWRQHFPRIQEIRLFNQTVQGQMINAYLDLVASHTPVDFPTKSKTTIRALFLSRAVKLQASLGAMAGKHQALRTTFSALLDDATISPSRLDAVQEARSHFVRHESAAADMKRSWTVGALRAQTWWLDAAELAQKLRDDLEALESIRARTEELEVEFSGPERRV